MRKVGSRELKNRLGRYLSLVEKGHTILVTDRGKPVAKLVPAEEEAPKPQDLDDKLRDWRRQAICAWERVHLRGLSQCMQKGNRSRG